MPAKFELYKDVGDKFRFRLIGANGEIVAQGQSYESKDGCLNGIKFVKTEASKAEIVDLSLKKTE